MKKNKNTPNPYDLSVDIEKRIKSNIKNPNPYDLSQIAICGKRFKLKKY